MGYFDYDSVIAQMYDADYAAFRTVGGDVHFYVEEAKRSGGPVAEFACGTGRVLIPTAQAGIEIVGVDASHDMLERARANLAAAETKAELRTELHAEFHQGDMRSHDLGRRFDLVTLPFRPLSHLTEVEDQLAAFKNFHRHLAPGGRLIFDVFQPNLAVIGSPEPREEKLDFERPGEDGGKVRRYSTAVHHPWRQLIDVRFRWELESPDGSISEEIAEFDMRWFYRYELEHLLARTGFVIETIHGSWEREPLGPESKELIFVCRAAG
ncbi:MAG: class I SAM-dependent methyltransferase [Planctomycetota bacterium]|jgi:SAM-dependent methyltransferase